MPITLTRGQALYVSDIIPAQSFTVGIDSAVDADIFFNWWIVDMNGAEENMPVVAPVTENPPPSIPSEKGFPASIVSDVIAPAFAETPFEPAPIPAPSPDAFPESAPPADTEPLL